MIDIMISIISHFRRSGAETEEILIIIMPNFIINRAKLEKEAGKSFPIPKLIRARCVMKSRSKNSQSLINDTSNRAVKMGDQNGHPQDEDNR